MKYRSWLVVIAVTGCNHHGASPQPDAAGDAQADASPDAGCRTPLFVGGTDPQAQGWVVVQQAPATLTDGADYTELATSTSGGATLGGQLLLTYANALPTTPPYAFAVELEVVATTGHNPYDAPVAIMASFTPPFGAGNDRNELIYLDAAALGWADNTQAAPAALTDGAYHTVVVSVDAAASATVSLDGVAVLTRGGFTTNGTIAVGDQTNDQNVDATTRLRAVTRLCAP